MPLYANADQLIQTGPAGGGAPLGYGDWRLTVELLLPTADGTPGQWDVSEWDNANWSELSWHDMTPYVRGAEWTRGSQDVQDRPGVGELTITLNGNDGRYSPIDPTNSFQGVVNVDENGNIVNFYFAPGTLVRVVAYSPTKYTHDPVNAPWVTAYSDQNWIPLFTGFVESWNEVRTHKGADTFIEITAIETIGMLARVDENALSSVVGDGDTVMERIERLGDAAGWPFGYIDNLETLAVGVDPDLPWEEPLQSTDMANNRLTELYLTADSVGATVRSDRSGAILVSGFIVDNETSTTPSTLDWDYASWQRLPGPIYGPSTTKVAISAAPPEKLPSLAMQPIYIDAEDIEIVNDASAVVNLAQFARKGSTVQEYSDTVSIDRYGKSTYGRGDLINKNDDLTRALARDMVLKRSATWDWPYPEQNTAFLSLGTARVVSVRINGDHEGSIVALAGMDIHGYFGATIDNGIYLDTASPIHVIEYGAALVVGMTHTLTMQGQRWHWEATYAFGEHQRPTYADYTPFTPLMLDNLDTWLSPRDASTVSLSGSDVTAIADKSGNGHDYTSVGSSDPQYGTETINGHNVLDVHSDDSMDEAGTRTLSQPFTMSLIIDADYWENDGRVLSDSTGTYGIYFNSGSMFNPTTNWWMDFGTGLNYDVDTTAAAHVLTFIVDGVSSSIRDNGVEVATGDVGANDLVSPRLFMVNNNHLVGQVGDIVIVNEALSGQDLTLLENYLMDIAGV